MRLFWTWLKHHCVYYQNLLFLLPSIPEKIKIIVPMSQSYIIVLELTPGRNYDQLYESIKNLGAWGRIFKSVQTMWLVDTTKNSVEIRDTLAPFLASTDSIFVARATRDGAWRGLAPTSDWIKEHLK